jgi:hypothetical protein
LSAAFVQKVAKRNDLGLDQARRRAVADTLFSLEARRVFEPEGTVGAVERSVWASALLNALREQAIAAGPATAKELAELRRQRWVEVDRPVSVAPVHAVVLVKKAKTQAAAQALAEKLHEATRGLSDPQKFAQKARSIKAKGLEARVEALAHVTADGRVVHFEEGTRKGAPNRFDPAFAAAANAIEQEGEISPVVESSYGYHVILLVERVDAQRYTDAQLRNLASTDIYRGRAERRLQGLESELRKQTHVEQARNFQQLTDHVTRAR